MIVPLRQPLDGKKDDIFGRAGRLATYASGRPTGPFLLLIHSVNAAASAYEVRPLFEHFATTRPVYALDLPGFGLSDRSDRPYLVRTMTDAILAVLADRRTNGERVAAPVYVAVERCADLVRDKAAFEKHWSDSGGFHLILKV